MGSTRPEREDARARTGVPLAPRDSARELPPWGCADVAALLELREALDAVISTRRSYDAGRRQR